MTSFAGPALLLVAAALLIVFLAENARIPIDDPNTHLELTMIHEVMVLDHGGPDFAMIQYGAMLKLWVLGTLLVGILVPVRSGWWGVDLAAGIAGMTGPGRAGRRDRIDDRPAAAGARAAVPGGGLGPVDPGPGTRDEVMRESLA